LCKCRHDGQFGGEPRRYRVSDEVHCLPRKTSRDFEIHHRLASGESHVKRQCDKLISATDLISPATLQVLLYPATAPTVRVARAVRQDPTSAGQQFHNYLTFKKKSPSFFFSPHLHSLSVNLAKHSRWLSELSSPARYILSSPESEYAAFAFAFAFAKLYERRY
jgi:hypothetical protein